MSSKPSKEGVENLRAALKDWRYLTSRLTELRKAAAQIEKVEQEAAAEHRKILKMLEGMDVKADGNMGWEGRILWFLNELDAQASDDPS